MKISVLTCFESNEERLRFVHDACRSLGFETNAMTSDFSHIRKEKRNSIPDGFVAIKTSPYKKNLSLQRMLSHYKFAKDAFQMIEEQDPDLIWLMAPANSLILQAKKYKQKHPEAKIIIDIIDMWPESLPVNISKNIFPFIWWRNIRKKNIDCCDLLVTECDLYQEILRKEYKGKIETIRWAREGKGFDNKKIIDDQSLSLVYIGSINNIIDADKIAKIISAIDMPVVLHVIGEGENTERFLHTVSDVCKVEYHGAIRDEDKKREIFDQCHAGINIYRDGLYIGLTVKCIDYFQHGLPIINNIKGDTWNLVQVHHAGVNISDNTIVDAKQLIQMRKNNHNIYKLYNENFTKEIFTEKCHKVINEVIK